MSDQEFEDKRAASVAESPIILPEGLTIKTPEEVAAVSTIDDPANQPEIATEAEQREMIEKIKAEVDEQNRKIGEALAPLGTYLLIRFENPTGVRHTVSFPSDPRLAPDTRAIIAVFNEELRKLYAFEQVSLTKRAEKGIQEPNENRMKVLGLNREERRLVDKLVRANVVEYVS